MPHENKQGNSKLFVAIFEETTIWNLLSSMTFLFFGDTVFPRRFAPIFTKQCWKNFQKRFKIPAPCSVGRKSSQKTVTWVVGRDYLRLVNIFLVCLISFDPPANYIWATWHVSCLSTMRGCISIIELLQFTTIHSFRASLGKALF